jgi:antitoxin VapB
MDNDQEDILISITSAAEVIVGEPRTAKLFKHGRSQAVRLPNEFRLPGTEVRVRRLGSGVLLEPIERHESDIRAIFTALDRYRDIPFMKERRQQPAIPPTEDVAFDE